MKINYTGDGVGLHQEPREKYIVGVVNKEQQLFNILTNLLQGEEELKTDKVHILQNTLENETSYRVYINDLCIDSYRIEEDQQIIFGLYSGWSGFSKTTIDEVLTLVTRL